MGCILVRQCHSNTCPVGVCTQDPALRAKFEGTPEKVVNLFTFIGEEVREILASLGASTLDEIVGRTDLLRQVSRGSADLDDLDLNPLLAQADPGGHPRHSTRKGRIAVPDTLDEQIISDADDALEVPEKMQLAYTIRNTHRTIGAKLSSHLTPSLRHGGAAARLLHGEPARLRRPIARRLGRAGPQDRGERRRQRLCGQGAFRRHHRHTHADL